MAECSSEHVRELLSGDPARLGARLREIAARQLSALDELEELSDAQAALLCDEASPMDGVLGALASRQSVIDRLVGLERELSAYLPHWAHVGEALGPDGPELAEAFAGVRARVLAVAARDRELHAALAARRDRAALELAGVRRGRSAMRAYSGGGAGRGARFRDGHA